MENNRDYLFDNIKALLIFLVVSVHMLAAVNTVYGPTLLTQMYMIVACSFHMPLFMFVSGYFTKLPTSRTAALNILIMYFFAQIILEVYNFIVSGMFSISGLLVPGFSMWYLFALFFLRYMLSDIVKIKHILLVSAITSIVIMGVNVSGNLDKAIIKTFANAIYFLLGYYTQEEYIKKICAYKHSKFVGILMIGIGVVCVGLVLESNLIKPHLLRVMMLRSTFVNKVEWGGGIGGYLSFAAVLLFAIWMSIAVILICPANKTFFSGIGRNTSSIYIAQAVFYLEFTRLLKNNMIMGAAKELYFVALVLSVLCVIIFGNSYMSKGFSKGIAIIREKIIQL